MRFSRAKYCGKIEMNINQNAGNKGRILLAAAISALLGNAVVAQETVPPEAESPTPTAASQNGMTHAEQQLLGMLDKMVQRLADLPGYELNVENTLTVSGGTEPLQRKVHLVMRFERTSKKPHAELVISQEEDKAPLVLVQWDGQKLSRVFFPEKIYCESDSQDIRENLRDCAFTSASLEAVRADFLLQPDLVEHVRHQLVHVSDWGVQDQVHHFKMDMTDGRKVDLWFDEQQAGPLPKKLESRLVSHTSEDSKVEVLSSVTFQWNLKPDAWEPLAWDRQAMRQVDGLLEGLSGQDSKKLIGQSLPEVMVQDADGAEQSLSKAVSESHQPTLLYFWATWAAPSVRELDSVKTFAQRLKDSGVAVRPVNVAEGRDEVTAFVKERELTFTHWFDPKGEAAATLGIERLPAVVILDADGKAQLILEGVDETSRPQIHETLLKLLPNQ